MSNRYGGYSRGTIMSKIEAKMLDDTASQDDWVDLVNPPSRGSTSSIPACSDQALLIDAQRSAVVSRHSNASPKSLQSPNVEFDNTLEAVKYKLARDVLPPGRNTDWIWDWSSRPEAQPPSEFRFRHPGGSLVTPPNSPSSYPSGDSKKTVGKDWSPFQMISVLIVTNVFTLVLGVCVGIWVARRCCQRSIEPSS